MSSFKNYTDLNAWKKGRELTNLTYCLTKKLPQEEIFGLTSQMRRCAVSIPSNIAEGLGRQQPKDVMHFLFIARGSLYELETQLYICSDQKFIEETELKDVLNNISEIRQLLSGLIRYIRNLKSRK